MVNSLTQDIFLHVSTPDKEQERIIAAIDIGTNSIHMVVVRIDPKLPAFTIIAKEKDTVRLGNCNPRTGELTPEAMNRAIATLQRCKEMAASLNAENIVAVATSAVREAPNGQAFLHQVYTELGLLV
ncbi:MAG: Ppx/GppA family phosphatase, partial [Moorea sp. SIO4A3]|nr:Ppx/GppA family phosphatase [Moorena sp. SIO4A3]